MTFTTLFTKWDDVARKFLFKTVSTSPPWLSCITLNPTFPTWTQDCLPHYNQSRRRKKAWWQTMTVFSLAAQKAENKLVTVISSSINEGCNTFKSTHERWRQRKQGWVIKQYEHARKGTFAQTRKDAPSRYDLTFPSSSVPTKWEGQNNPVKRLWI